MVDNFFQERFDKNLRFYEGKTPEELSENYEQLYEGLEQKDIFLAELMSVKKILIDESETRNDINFADYINDIEELYSQIDQMSEHEMQKKSEEIKMIIVAVKLSLNSPTYFTVNVDELRKIKLNEKLKALTEKISSKADTTLIQSFKAELDEEIVKKEKIIDDKKQALAEQQKNYEKLEQAYWNFSDPSNDMVKNISEFLGNNLITDPEKSICLIQIGTIYQGTTPEKIEELNKIIRNIVYRIRKDMNYTHGGILLYEQYSSLMRKLAQCIDKNGNFIQLLSDELIDECKKQIEHTKLNPFDLQSAISIGQTRLAKKQYILAVMREIEKRKKALTPKVKAEDIKKEEIKLEEKTGIPNEFKEVLDVAKEVINIELETGKSKNEMQLDEMEALFVEELKDADLTEETINRLVINDANSDLCRMKFIVYGMNYQLENINQTNLSKSIKLISVYLEYYNKIKQLIIKKTEEKENNIERINEKTKLLKEKKSIYASDEKLFEQLTDEQKKYLNSYVNVNLKSEEREETGRILATVGLDLNTLTLYNAYKLLDSTINETLELLEILKDEKITEDDEKQINDLLESVKELCDQYEVAKKIYEESKKIEEEKLIANNIQTQDNQDNILIFFENEDGKTQAEERILTDLKKFGRLNPGEINEIERLFTLLKTTSPSDLRPPISTYIKNGQENVGRRLSKNGSIRLAYEQIPSDVLNTDKPVYLIISVGIKKSEKSGVYEDAIHFRTKVDDYIDYYRTLKYATQEQKQAFLNKQVEHENMIIEVAKNGKEAYHANNTK